MMIWKKDDLIKDAIIEIEIIVFYFTIVLLR